MEHAHYEFFFIQIFRNKSQAPRERERERERDTKTMAFFMQACLSKQEASIKTLLQDVEQALQPNAVLSVMQFRSDGDVPYFRVGFVWRTLQHHLGKVKKAAEIEWKQLWKDVIKSEYEHCKKDRTRWEQQLQVHTLQWLEDARQELRVRLAQKQTEMGKYVEPLTPAACSGGLVVGNPEAADVTASSPVTPRDLPADTPGSVVECKSKLLRACTPGQYVEVWDWVGAAELRQVDNTFDFVIDKCFQESHGDVRASMAALSNLYLQPAMTKVDIALIQLRVKESEIALWKPVQASHHATRLRAQQVAAEANK